MEIFKKNYHGSDLPTFWELPGHLRWKLTKEFTVFVFKSIKFRHWVMFLSFWALAFQTDKLLDTYLIFDTIVKVEMIKPEYVDLPGVTICTDPAYQVSRKKLMDRYPQIEKELKEKNVTEEHNIIKVLRKWKEKAYNESNVDEWFGLMIDPQSIMDCKMIRKPEWHKQHNQSMPDCYNISQPVYHTAHGVGICWTFFSQVNRRDYKTIDWVRPNQWYRIEVQMGILANFHIHYRGYYNNEFVYDELQFNPDNPEGHPELASIITYPKAIYGTVSLDRATIKPGTNYEMNFAQTNSILLNKPYHTDCRHYEEEGYWKPFKSNYQCIDNCYQEYMKKCNCTYRESRGERVTQWPPDDAWDSKVRFCDDNRTNFEHKKEDVCVSSYSFLLEYTKEEYGCRLKQKCKNHCHEEYYRYEVRQLFWDEDIDGKGEQEMDDEDYFYTRGEKEYPKAQANDNFSMVRIKRKDMPDVTYEHKPDMIFVEFVCYFGGLLGLWLGVSILDCYHQFIAWYGEAPGAYRKWLERNSFIDNRRIKVQPNGRISIISEQMKSFKQRNGSLANQMPSVDNKWRTEYANTYGTQFS